MAAVLSFSGCGGGSDGDPGATGADGRHALIAVSAELAGPHCASGGSRVDAGLDADGNGTLDAVEIGSTQYVCHGAIGAPGTGGSAGAAGTDGLSTLAQMLDEPAGSHCAAGGKAIRVGVDANANGVLDTTEVGSTGYVCNGRDGAPGTDGAAGADGANGLDALVAIVGEPAGANCTHGGSRVSAGVDANADSVLDPAEVDSTTYLCNGAPGNPLNWVVVTDPAVQALPNTGYIASNDAQSVVVTLPASPLPGDLVRITGAGVGGWTIAQNAGQAVYTTNLGGAPGTTTTPGTGGSISGTQFSTLTLLYMGNSRFNVVAHEGDLTVL